MTLYYHPRMLAYDFGPQHPLRPERVQRAMALLGALGFEPTDPGAGDVEDALRVHSEEYVEAVRQGVELSPSERARHGLGAGDTPAFERMFEASLSYLAGSVAAARHVSNGGSRAVCLRGGLHHAQHNRAGGFCVFNDCAVALDILKERFGRIAYVDIDVHHGDGTQALFYDEPDVLTCSIHQDGRALYPGTGFVTETGASYSSLNVPLWPRTTGDVWLWAFRQTVLPALERFRPEAIVLQMGADSHFLDPLAQIENTAQEWLDAVRDVHTLGLPLVVGGGGGYHPNTVPRMWAAAVLTLCDKVVPQDVPEPFGDEWDMPKFFDVNPPGPRNSGRARAEEVVTWLEDNFLPKMVGA